MTETPVTRHRPRTTSRDTEPCDALGTASHGAALLALRDRVEPVTKMRAGSLPLQWALLNVAGFLGHRVTWGPDSGVCDCGAVFAFDWEDEDTEQDTYAASRAHLVDCAVSGLQTEEHFSDEVADSLGSLSASEPDACLDQALNVIRGACSPR